MAISCLFLAITTGPMGMTSRQVTKVPSGMPKRVAWALIISSGREIILTTCPLFTLSSVIKHPPLRAAAGQTNEKENRYHQLIICHRKVKNQ
jgi:hypothetical protein